ncbi:hypothetical protein C8R44DRAFT_890156 [Mycena epipterygia]|nr:hypothetical protein C8R44DRAFT_890156 [Mycena epipterygia]
MSAANPGDTDTSIVFTGSIENRKVDDLKVLCLALGLEKKDLAKKKKNDLVSLINTWLDTYPSLEDEEKFAPLFQFRRDHPAQQPRSSKKIAKLKKTSASKAAEDQEEKSKTSKALTGATLNLFDQKVTTDPVGSVRPLGSQPVKKEAGDEDDEEEDNGKDDDEEKGSPLELDLRLPKTTQSSSSVTPQIRRIQHALSAGSVKHEVNLTELVPLAINTDTPMKADRAGRVGRPGIYPITGNGPNIMSIGSIGQLLEGGSIHTNLNFDRGNKIVLNDLGEDVFGVQLYYEPTVTPSIMAPPVLPPTSLTGADTDRPLEIAQQRHRAKPIPPKRALEVTAHLSQFLREFTQSDVLPQDTNFTAGQALDAYLLFSKFASPFKVWNKKGAGYTIPPDFIAPDYVTSPGWEQYRNGTFTQKELIAAAGLTSTCTRNNNSLFAKAKELPGRIGRWVNAPRVKAEKKDSGDEDIEEEKSTKGVEFLFDHMKLKDFNAIVQEKYKKYQDRLKGIGRAGGSKKSTKHTRSYEDSDDDGNTRKKKKKRVVVGDSDDGSEEEKRSKKKGKGKAKAPRESTSDNMDSDSGSDD